MMIKLVFSRRDMGRYRIPLSGVVLGDWGLASTGVV